MLQAVKLAVAPVAWRILRGTVRLAEYTPHDAERDQPAILACLHRDILPTIMHVRPMRPTLLVSGSPDGDILIRTLGHRYYRFVRGATGEDGKRAFVQLRRELDAGRSIGLAVDGPKGPFGVINEGVLQLSRLSGRPIIPLRAEPVRWVALDTWDRTVVPFLFSRVVMRCGARVIVAREGGEADLAAVRAELTRFFGEKAGAHADT